MSSDSQPVFITKLDDSGYQGADFAKMVTPHVVKYNKFLAVTPLNVSGASEFYQKTRNAGSPLMDDPELPEEKLCQLRSYICECVIRSPLFQKRYQCEGTLDMQDSATYDKISHDYPNIVEARQSRKKFVNPYVLRNVEQSHPEEVFSCFAQKRGSEDVALYFISHEYVVEGPVEKSVTGTGRFIYENIVGREDLTAIAFAEEPPERNIFRPQSDNWQDYLDYQFYDLDRSYYSEDGYKDMSTFDKIRLCGLVFRSRLYREKVEFVPEEENIDPGLVRRAVEFIHNEGIRKEKVSDVWMIPCKVEYLPKKVSINRYIVRGNKQFFICGDTQNKGFTFVEGYMQGHKAIVPVYL